MMKASYRALVAATIASLLLPISAGAQVRLRPRPQIQLSRGAVDPIARTAPLPRAQHNIFGTMGQIGPRRFLLKTRSGRIMLVDDTIALNRGTYSAPLFNGKVVMISGSYDRARLFHAQAVTRFTQIDNQTPPDN